MKKKISEKRINKRNPEEEDTEVEEVAVVVVAVEVAAEENIGKEIEKGRAGRTGRDMNSKVMMRKRKSRNNTLRKRVQPRDKRET